MINPIKVFNDCVNISRECMNNDSDVYFDFIIQDDPDFMETMLVDLKNVVAGEMDFEDFCKSNKIDSYNVKWII